MSDEGTSSNATKILNQYDASRAAARSRHNARTHVFEDAALLRG